MPDDVQSAETGMGCATADEADACVLHATDCVHGCSGANAAALGAFVGCYEGSFKEMMCIGAATKDKKCVTAAGVDGMCGWLRTGVSGSCVASRIMLLIPAANRDQVQRLPRRRRAHQAGPARREQPRLLGALLPASDQQWQGRLGRCSGSGGAEEGALQGRRAGCLLKQ